MNQSALLSEKAQFVEDGSTLELAQSRIRTDLRSNRALTEPQVRSFSAQLDSYRLAPDLNQLRQSGRFEAGNSSLDVEGLPCSVNTPPQRLGESDYLLASADPNPAFHASNLEPAQTRRYLVNGVSMRPQDLAEDIQLMTAMTGQPVTAVVNSPGSSLLKGAISTAINFFAPAVGNLVQQHASGYLGDVVSAAASFISPQLTRWMEPEAATKLREHLFDDFENGRESVIDVFRQGGSILRATLNGIQNELAPEEWERFKEGIAVIASGSVAHTFPEGIAAIEYEHTGDLVSSLTKPLAQARDSLLATLGLSGNTADYQTSEVVELKALSGRTPHDFTGYIENYPRFFLASHRTGEGTLDVEGFSAALAKSIERGHYSDQFHRKLIELVLKTNQSEEFRSEFDGHVDDFGNIGNFQVYHPHSSSDVQVAANQCRHASTEIPDLTDALAVAA